MKINLEQLTIRLINKVEEPRYRELMQQHHYLGDLAKIGHTLWYVVIYDEKWAAYSVFRRRHGNVVQKIAGLAGVTDTNIAVSTSSPTIAVF